MDQTSILMLILIWTGVIFTLATGLFYTANYRVRRKDSPREFWTAFGVGIVVAIVATLLIVRLR